MMGIRLSIYLFGVWSFAWGRSGHSDLYGRMGIFFNNLIFVHKMPRIRVSGPDEDTADHNSCPHRHGSPIHFPTNNWWVFFFFFEVNNDEIIGLMIPFLFILLISVFGRWRPEETLPRDEEKESNEKYDASDS